MAESHLPLTADEQAALATITTRFPGLVQAVEAQVARLIEAAFARLPGIVATEAGVDSALVEVVDRVVAQGLREHASLDVTDDACGAMTLLIARNAATQARDGLVRRLLDPKRN